MDANTTPLSYGVRQAIRDSAEDDVRDREAEQGHAAASTGSSTTAPAAFSRSPSIPLGLFLGLKLTCRGRPSLSGHGEDSIVFDESGRAVALDKLIGGPGDDPLSVQLGRAVVAPQERRGEERVIGGAAQFDERGDEDDVDDAEAAAGDGQHHAGPEGDREGREGVGGGELGSRVADEAQGGEEDQVGDGEVGRYPIDPSSHPSCRTARVLVRSCAARAPTSWIGSRLALTRVHEGGRWSFAPSQRASALRAGK